MTPAQFDDLLARQPALVPHADFVRSLLLPCVRISISNQGPNGAQSKFGGKPMAAPGFTWPQHDVGVYRFLGQINFAEITDRPPELPASGLLVLFYADWGPDTPDDAEIFWRDEGYIKAWYFEDLSQLTQLEPPDSQYTKAKRITLQGELDIIRDRYMRKDWPFDFALLGELIDDPDAMYGKPSPDAILPTDYMLGYPSHYSLGYNPTPGPEWRSLLTLHSHQVFDWQWHDGNKLMVFIENDKLAARDFSQLQCDAG